VAHLWLSRIGRTALDSSTAALKLLGQLRQRNPMTG
jgi:hypothetical protein